jgi:hypothetical protein
VLGAAWAVWRRLVGSQLHAWHAWSWLPMHTSTFVVVIHSTIMIAIHARTTLARSALARSALAGRHLTGFGSLPKVWTVMATD